MQRLLCLLALLTCGSLTAAPQVVKIGVDMHLTDGGQVGNGEELRTGVQMAVDDLNARKDTPYTYQVVFEDNGYTPRGAVMAARKLISIDKVDALYTMYDLALAPAAPIAKQQNIANFAYAWGLNWADGTHNFVFCSSEVMFARELYKPLAKEDKRTEIVVMRQPFSETMVGEFSKLRMADKQTPYEVTYFNPGENDFRTMILRLQERKAERIVLLAFGNEMNKFLYQLKMNPDFKPELFGMTPGMSEAEDRRSVIGRVVAGNRWPPNAFIEKLGKALGRPPASPQEAVYAYDCFRLMAEALEAVPPSSKPIRERILEALRAKKSFNGYTGRYTQQKGVFDAPAQLFRITASGLEPYTP